MNADVITATIQSDCDITGSFTLARAQYATVFFKDMVVW